MEQQSITEEMNIHQQWYEDADKQTIESLPEFIRHLTEDYKHDYGTICHAMAAASLAAIHAVDNCPQGGITGFQAGCIMWQIVRKMNYKNNKCGLKILDYDNLVYPQNERTFTTIPKSFMEEARKLAKGNIERFNTDISKWKELHEQWNKDLAKFKTDVVEWQKDHPEYPTYAENPKFYQRIGCGTSAEWEEQRRKENAGFMFEPEEPYKPSVAESVMEHWEKTAYDPEFVPFGLSLSDD